MNPATVNANDISVRGFFNGSDGFDGAFGFNDLEKIDVLDSPNLLTQSWAASMQIFPKQVNGENASLDGTVISQVSGGSGFELLFVEGVPAFVVHSQTMGSDTTFFPAIDVDGDWWVGPSWKVISVEVNQAGYSLDSEPKIYVTLFADNTAPYTQELNVPEPNLDVLRIGNNVELDNNFNASVKDFRLWYANWNDPASSSYDIADNPYVTLLHGDEAGLAMWLKTRQIDGNVSVVDDARGRVLSSSAHLELPEGGYSLAPNTSDDWSFDFDVEWGGPKTLEFWLKRSDNAACDIVSDAIDAWAMKINESGSLVVEYNMDELMDSVVSNSTLEVGAWQHVALVGESSELVKMYIDGMEVASHQFEQAVFMPIGLQFSGHLNSLNGNIDEIRVWDRSLSQDELLSNMFARISGRTDLISKESFEELDLASGMAGMSSSAGIMATSMLWDNEEFAYIGLERSPSVANAVISQVHYNALNDEFQLEFEESELYQFEDQVVEVLIGKEMTDVLGNELAQDLSWRYFFDQSPLKISQNSWSDEIELGEQASFVFEVFNQGMDAEPFSIVDIPNWLNVSPEQGVLPPFGTMEVTVSTNNTLDLGSHLADIRITGDFCQPGQGGAPDWCFGERLSTSIDVQSAEPEYIVETGSFDENMTLVARVMNGQYFSDDPDDIVLAYVGEELRGVAKLDVDVASQHFAFVTIHFDSSADLDEPISFRVWDSSRGLTFTSVETLWPNVASEVTVDLNSGGGENYSILTPLLLKTSDRVLQTIELDEGWNWVSFNVGDERFENGAASVFSGLSGTIEEARNQTDVAIWENGVVADFGLVTGLNDMYQLKVNEDATLELSGLIPDRIADAQTLHSGWQHLGYNAQRKMPIDDALLHLTDEAIAMDGDVIKSRDHGFAVYFGDEWVGSLTHMEPDQGYKLYLGQEGDDSLGELVFPADAMIPGFDIRHEPATPDVWEQDVSELMATSTAIVRIETTRPVHRSPHDVLGAFAEIDGEWKCVGQAFALSQDGDALYFLTTYTEGSMTDLSFKWYADEESQSFESDDHALFIADELRGTLTDPFVLRFETPHADLGQSNEAGRGGVADGVGPCNAKLQISPSLVDNELAANVFVECAILSIDVVDVTGNNVTSLPLGQMGEVSCQGTPGQTLTCDVQRLASGMYRLVVSTEEGLLTAPFVKAQ